MSLRRARNETRAELIPPIGHVTLWLAWHPIPPGYLPAQGQRVSKARYRELAAVLIGAGMVRKRPECWSWWPWFRVPDFREEPSDVQGAMQLIVVIKAEDKHKAMARDLANWRW